MNVKHKSIFQLFDELERLRTAMCYSNFSSYHDHDSVCTLETDINNIIDEINNNLPNIKCASRWCWNEADPDITALVPWGPFCYCFDCDKKMNEAYEKYVEKNMLLDLFKLV